MRKILLGIARHGYCAGLPGPVWGYPYWRRPYWAGYPYGPYYYRPYFRPFPFFW